MTKWKEGDWVVFDLRVGQVKGIRDGYEEFTDGVIGTSGGIADRFRPLTIRNKCTAETFDYYYKELGKLSGEAGFNYPDISRHFNQLALDAMDGDVKDRAPYEKAQEFVRDAGDYKPVIQGVSLFRPNLKRRAN